MKKDSPFTILLLSLLIMSGLFEFVGFMCGDQNLQFAGALTFLGVIIAFCVTLVSIWQSEHPNTTSEPED